MRTRLLLFFMILSLLVLPVMPGVQPAVRAEGQVSIRALLDESLVLYVEGKPYIQPLSRFRMQYTITNGLPGEIEVVELLEEIITKNNETTLHTLPLDEVLLSSEHKEVNGRFYNGEIEFAPYTLRYKLRFIGPDNPEIQELSGQATIMVIDTRMQATYRLATEQPIFKGDEVKYVAEIESRANVTLYNVIVNDNLLGEVGRIDVIVPGEKKTLEKTVVLNETTESYLILTYDDPLGHRENITLQMNLTKLNVDVRSEASVVSLSITGKADKAYLPAASQVQFTLAIKNTGNTLLNDVECLDAEGNVIFTRDQLNPDEEMEVIHQAMAELDMDYEFTVLGIAEGSSQRIRSTTTVRIHRLDPRVEIERSIRPEKVVSGVPFILTITVRNTGNVALTDLLLEEPVFGEIGRYTFLDVNDEVVFTKELTTQEASYSRTVLTATDRAGYAYGYEAVEMLIPMESDPESVGLSLLLRADDSDLKKAGAVDFEYTIKNTGTVPLIGMELKLMERGIVLERITELAPGEERVLMIPSLVVDQTEVFFIQAEAKSPDGQIHPFKSNILTVEVRGGTPAGRAALLRVVLIVIVLLIIFIIGTLFYIVKGPFKLPVRRKRRNLKG